MDKSASVSVLDGFVSHSFPYESRTPIVLDAGEIAPLTLMVSSHSFGLAVDKLLSGSYNDNNARTMNRQEYSSAALEGGRGNGILPEPGRRY